MKITQLLRDNLVGKFLRPGNYIDENLNDINITKPIEIIDIEFEPHNNQEILIILADGKTANFANTENIPIIHFNKVNNLTKYTSVKRRLTHHIGLNDETADNVLNLINEYTDELKKRLDYHIEHSQKNTTLHINEIRGALRNCIQFHGPITESFIDSAAKRIAGHMYSTTNSKKPNHIIIIDK